MACRDQYVSRPTVRLNDLEMEIAVLLVASQELLSFYCADVSSAMSVNLMIVHLVCDDLRIHDAQIITNI